MTVDTIYALDIGTRKVMGLVVSCSGAKASVIDAEVVEHTTRAMAAGQIQDVGQVASAVRSVTAALSRRTGLPLRRAALAVAGRNLKTARGLASCVYASGRELTPRDLERGVMEALGNALGTLAPGYQCVGYAVIGHRVDGETLARPAGRWAYRLETEILATLLPRRVLDGLFSVLGQADLEADAITLEPIAALAAVIPEELKRFHLALVDVGAGTSDIAIVRDGCVQSFGMVPCAGDFVTEALGDSYLLDFNTAERIKRGLSCSPWAQAQDIFHRLRRIESPQAVAALAPHLADLAGKIAGHILELGQGQKPRAVVCVGGGGLVPGFEAALARALDLSPERVGLKTPEAALEISNPLVERLGPQAATPLGIALVASSGRGLTFRKVFFNDAPLHLLDLGRPLDVMSVLAAAAMPAAKIYGKPGLAKTFTVNGELRALKGGEGFPAIIDVNGSPAALDHPVAAQDRIRFEEAICGQEASGTVGEVLEEFARVSEEGGRSVKIYPRALLNGAPCELETPLPDRASLTWETHAPAAAVVASGLEVIVNGRPVLLNPGRDAQVMLVDLFKHISISTDQAVGKKLRLLLNGQEARFTSPLHHGAEVKVYFE